MQLKSLVVNSTSNRLIFSYDIFSTRKYATNFQATPRITVPHKLFQKLQKLEAKNSQQEKIRKSKLPRSKISLITCRNAKFNQYKGQMFSKFEPIPLASFSWFNKKSIGDYIVIHSVQNNPAIVSEISEGENNFRELGLSLELCNALEQMGIENPTNIQMLAIPSILCGQNVLCASETGSGKTFAYLAPIIEQYLENKKHKQLNHPCSLVLVPSRELAEQVDNVADTLSNLIPFKKQILIGGRGVQIEEQYNDLLIATPGILAKMLSRKLYNLKNVNHIVIDEVDTMLDDSFNKIILKILKHVVIREEVPQIRTDLVSGTQLTLVGATLPRSVEEIFQDVVRMDTLTKITTNHLHKLTLHIPHKFLRIASVDRANKCLQMIKTNIPTMIFCNKSKCSDWLSMFLKENQIDNLTLNGNMPLYIRKNVFKKFQEGFCNILVCTDIASRGLDTLRVQHIINYDFPHFISDYIHRVGRTGRLGSSSGHVTNFISFPRDIELTQQIEVSARKLQDLPNVNANIKRKICSLMSESQLNK